MNNVYCPLPWVGMNILPGEVRPCCHWDGAAIPLEQVRQDMIAGKELKGCNQCTYAEKVGSTSYRKQAIAEYGIVTEPSLQVLEVTFDNTCNLKCRGCCSFSSHLWYNDEKEIYGKSFISKKYLGEDINFDCSNLKQVDISGGEPFLSKKVEKFLVDLDTNGIIENVKIGIVTNGTVIPSEAVIKSLLKAKKLYLSISIDGIGSLNDYFRSGSNFDKILENINFFNKFYEQGNCLIIIQTIVSIYNVNCLNEIDNFFKTKYPHFKLEHRMMQWPEQLSVQNMPSKLKEIVLPIVESFGPNYNDVLNSIKLPGKDLWGHFLNFHNKLDHIRNEQLPNKLLLSYIEENKVHVDSSIFFKNQIRG